MLSPSLRASVNRGHCWSAWGDGSLRFRASPDVPVRGHCQAARPPGRAVQTKVPPVVGCREPAKVHPQASRLGRWHSECGRFPDRGSLG